MEGKWLTNLKMSINSVTKLTMQCSLEKGKCSKMYYHSSYSQKSYRGIKTILIEPW